MVFGLEKLDEYSIKTHVGAGDAKRVPNPVAPGNWRVSARVDAVCGLRFPLDITAGSLRMPYVDPGER